MIKAYETGLITGLIATQPLGTVIRKTIRISTSSAGDICCSTSFLQQAAGHRIAAEPAFESRGRESWWWAAGPEPHSHGDSATVFGHGDLAGGILGMAVGGNDQQ